MKKKFFLICAVIVVMVATFTISASADEIFNLTLDGVENKRNPEEWDDGYNSDYTYYEIVDEMIHIYGTMLPDGSAATQSIKIPYGKSIEGEALVFYDIMFPSADADCKQGVSTQYFFGNNRVTSSHNPAMMEVGVWYNIMLHVDQVNQVAYYRQKLTTENEWGVKNAASFNAGNSAAAGFKAYIQPSNKKDSTHRADVYFDNIRVIQNFYIDDFKFMHNDEEITSVADITSEGNVKAVFAAMNYDLDYNSESVVPDRTKYTPMMVAFDKDGMMLDCAIYQDIELAIYDNPVTEYALDITDIKDRFAGGTIRFYIWDSIDNMEAIFDEIILPATAVVEQ